MIEGDIPAKLLNLLKKEYGSSVQIIEDETLLAVDTDWYKKTKKNMNPAKYLCLYREARGLTQEQLGKMLNGLSRQRISDMENGRRIINKDVAKKLAKIFNTSIEKFL